MGATVGLAVALSRSAPPATGAEVGPITALLGFPAPPPLTPSRYLSSFYPDLLWLTVGVVAAVGYVAAVVRLSRRGVRWPWLRTVSWLVGCGVLVWVTSGGPGVYGRLHFSTHMVQHMALMSVVPAAAASSSGDAYSQPSPGRLRRPSYLTPAGRIH